MSYPGPPLPPGAGASASNPAATYPPAQTDDAYAAYYAQMMADPAYAAYYAQYYYGSAATPAAATTAATTASVPVDLDSVIVKTESKKGKSTSSSSKAKTAKSTTAAAAAAATSAVSSASAAPAPTDAKRGTVRKHAEMESGSATPVPPPSAPSKTAAAPSSSGVASASGAAASADADPSGPPAKKKRVLRYAAGQVWEDKSLEDWPDNDFRLFVGDLGPEVTTAMLQTAFGKYESFQRAYVVQDKAGKSKGYGFVSFMNADDYTRAFRDYNNKYLGSRPVKLRKSTWQDRNIEVKKQKMRRGF
ncbi:RNA-binding protein 42 [Allomyces javanicus]|nr:RNA-binding protein 42 [Allomyces javanicus]